MIERFSEDIDLQLKKKIISDGQKKNFIKNIEKKLTEKMNYLENNERESKSGNIRKWIYTIKVDTFYDILLSILFKGSEKMPKKPFVISIASLSGGGKSTIVNILKEQLINSTVIYFDDYGDDVYLNSDINDWSKKGNDYNEWNVSAVAADLQRLLNDSYNYIILDYPFGDMNDCVGKYIDLTVFVDTPLDVALARRIIRDYTSRSQESNFGFADVEEVSLAAIDKELRYYLSYSRPTYARMAEILKLTSAVIVDGMRSPAEIVDKIIEKIYHTMIK